MDQNPAAVTRRQALTAGFVATVAGGAAFAGANQGASNPPAPDTVDDEKAGTKSRNSSPARMPVVYLPHGGGPWPFVELGIGSKAELAQLTTYLEGVPGLPNTPAKALLVISAHWEEPVPTVMTSAQPPMLYDYYGFPPESYEITWPAPGAPELAHRVRQLLEGAGIETGEDSQRGYDHGTFVPLKLAYPDARVPTVQLSLKRGLNPAEHLALGRALQPLRDEGVFIIGSGMSYHNLRAFGPAGRPVADVFDAWLQKSMSLPPKERDAQLEAWSSAPSARQAHPREEHLLPLMVIAGAAGDDVACVGYAGTIMGLKVSAYHFG